MTGYNTVLAIDTALNGCGVGLYERLADKTAAKSLVMTTGQSEALIPLVQDIVGDFKKLDAIAVTIGPGAFTGMRIGISTAKSLALALSIPVFGITTFQAVALGYKNAADPFAVILDTKREDFYFQGFDVQATPQSDPALLSRAEIEEIMAGGTYKTCIGNGSESFGGKDRNFDLGDCGAVAKALSVNTETFFTTDLAPLYLRDADTSISKKTHRILES